MSEREWPEDENDLSDEELLAAWDRARPAFVIRSPLPLVAYSKNRSTYVGGGPTE